MEVSNERVMAVRTALHKFVFAPEITIGDKTGIKLLPPNVVEHLTHPDMVREFFLKTFTHVSAGESYTQVAGRVRVSQNNYEEQELAGDSLANLFVIEDIRSEFPDISISERNNLLSYYKSNEVFGKALRDSIPGVDALIRTAPSYTRQEKMYGDVMEALVMAVCDAGNTIIPGYGYACARNVFTLLMRKVTMDKERAKGHAKSYVTSIVKGIKETSVVSANNVTVTLTIPPEKIDELKVWAPSAARMPTMYKATASNKQLASSEAYGKIKDTLDRVDATLEARDEHRLQTNLNQMGQNGKKINELLKERQETLVFSKRDTGDGNYEYRLVARDSEGNSYYIGSDVRSSGTQSTHEAHKALLKMYLDAAQ